METKKIQKPEKKQERIHRAENLEDLLFANAFSENVNEYSITEEKLRSLFDEAINMDD